MLQKRGSGDTANYLMKYKGTYRLRTEVDKRLKSFPREYDGSLADNDVYIDCEKNARIFHYGKGILEYYIPSLKSGNTIIRTIYRDFINKNNTETTSNTYEIKNSGKSMTVTKQTISILDEVLFREELNKSEFIFNIVETDSEILFQFHSKHLKELENILNPKTYGSDRSPFSSKNLEKTKYIIPDEELEVYKVLTSKIPKNELILLAKYTTSFIQSLVTKRNSWEDIKADMVLKGLKGKEYIHSIGKWDDYIKYLESNL